MGHEQKGTRVLITTRILAFFWLAGSFTGITLAQETNDGLDTKAWGKAYSLVARRIRVDVGSGQPAKWVETPMLSWDNPIRIGRTEGDFFVWLHNDRPALVGTVFSYDWPSRSRTNRSISLEFHGVSNVATRVSYGQRELWKLPEDGISSIPLDVPKPRERRIQRRIQMRQIASRIQAETTYRNETQQLRLMPNPVYRFDLPESGSADGLVLDGAIFAMVTGTDPELLLVVEALRTSPSSKAYEWQLKPVRFTDLPLKLTLPSNDTLEMPSRFDDPLYFAAHRFFVVPTELGETAEQMIAQ
ncbi:MAG: hypothetical protein AAGA03_12210 [Planctomycetota bacterium]